MAFSLPESRDCTTDSPSPASPILKTVAPSVSSLQSRALPRASGCSLSSKNGLFQNLRMGPLCSLPTLVLAGNCRVRQAKTRGCCWEEPLAEMRTKGNGVFLAGVRADRVSKKRASEAPWETTYQGRGRTGRGAAKSRQWV